MPGRADRSPRCSSSPPAAGALIGPVDGDGAAAELLAVHALDGVAQRLLVVEPDEAEAAGSARLPVGDDLINYRNTSSTIELDRWKLNQIITETND